MHNIRPLSADDLLVGLTHLLHRAYACLGRMGLNYTAVDQTPDVTAKRIAYGQCFVAELAAAVVGTIVVHPTATEDEYEYYVRPGVAAIHQFGVEPAHQNQGIGSALLRVCEVWARERGYRELAMDTAEPATHLIGLYERLGYKQVGNVPVEREGLPQCGHEQVTSMTPNPTFERMVSGGLRPWRPTAEARLAQTLGV